MFNPDWFLALLFWLGCIAAVTRMAAEIYNFAEWRRQDMEALDARKEPGA